MLSAGLVALDRRNNSLYRLEVGGAIRGGPILELLFPL